MIGLFGGTFDPVHAGHLAVMREAQRALALDELRVLPAGDPWQKSDRPITPAHHRVAMLKLAMAEDFNAILDTRELRRTGPTYTVDTLSELRGEVGDACVFFWLIGSDAYAKISTWHRAADLRALTHFAVVMRDDASAASPPNERFVTLEVARLRPGGCAIHLPIATPDVSSTQIRALVAKGGSARGLITDAVCDYIQTHHLYKE